MSIDNTVLCSASSALDRGRVLPEQISRKIRGCCGPLNSGDTGSDGETVAVPSGITGVKLDDGGIGVDGICVGMDSSTGKLPETLCDCINPDMMGVCGKMPSPTGELCAIGVLGCWESISLVAIVGLESTLFSQCGVESC